MDDDSKAISDLRKAMTERGLDPQPLIDELIRKVAKDFVAKHPELYPNG